ncbi:MAG: ankyrin repeat domain-containing protein [Hyphomicrobiales bacterium]
MQEFIKFALLGFLLLQVPVATEAQQPPSSSQIAAYEGLFKAAYEGNIEELKRLIAEGADVGERDVNKRTPLHVAAYASHEKALELLVKAGADPNAFDSDSYDIITIAAVANDVDILNIALELGTSARNVTSPYEGTALIAAAHLGHHGVVKILIDAGAPLDHINNLHWTALMESVVLGNGGPNHVRTAHHLLGAGADKSIGDSNGTTPYEHAVRRGYAEMIDMLK